MNALIDCVLRNVVSASGSVFGENSSFIAFAKEDGDFSWSSGFQSGAQFGRIVYRTEEETVEYSDRLVLKVTPPLLLMKEFTMLAFYNEVFFHTRILPTFETMDPDIRRLFPKYYNSLLQYNVDSDEGVIVFENLQARGYTPSPKKSFLDYDQLSLMMRKLGQFHAFSYRAREQKPDNFHALTLCMAETNGFVLKQSWPLTPCMMRGAECVLSDPHYKSKCSTVLDMINRYHEIISDAYTDSDQNNPTHVLCHGDYLGNNVLFKHDSKGKPSDLKIVDLGNWRFASPAIDITLVLYVNADQKMRNEHWDDLIEEYYTALQNTFPSTEVPSKDLILEDFKTKAVVAYIVNSYFLPFLIAHDNDDTPGQVNILPQEYKNLPIREIPYEHLYDSFTNTGGERATTALADVLKDLIDRGFL